MDWGWLSVLGRVPDGPEAPRYDRARRSLVWLNLTILLFGLGGDPVQGRHSLDVSSMGECAPGGDSRTLKLDATVDPTTIVPTRSQEREPAPPRTSKVRVTLTNPGPKELRLTFPDSCFLGYRVETPDGADLPQEDSKGCASALMTVTLAPGASESMEFRWTARSWDELGRFTPLPAGKYRIFGTLAKRFCGKDGQEEPPLQTAPVVVEVRPAAN
jgi:hypothetical protein